MTDRDEFPAWVDTTLYEAELALHNGMPRHACALVSQRAGQRPRRWRDAHGQRELDELFAVLAQSFSDCSSFEFELQAHDVVGDLASTAGLEHTSASVNGEPRSSTLRVTQVDRREEGQWRVAHRHGDTVTESKEEEC